MRIPFLSPPFPALRAASFGDAEALSGLHAEGGFSTVWTIGDFEALLADRSVVTDVACDSRSPARLFGFCMSRVAADEAEILTIAVRKKARGQGLGRKLLAAQMARLESKGIATLFLEVEELNRAARALYDREGFLVVGRRDGYYRKPDGRSATALIMKCDLSDG